RQGAPDRTGRRVAPWRRGLPASHRAGARRAGSRAARAHAAAREVRDRARGAHVGARGWRRRDPDRLSRCRRGARRAARADARRRRARAPQDRGRRAALGPGARRPHPARGGRARDNTHLVLEGLLPGPGAGGAPALPRSSESRPARARAGRRSGVRRGARARRQGRGPGDECRTPHRRLGRRARVRTRRGAGRHAPRTRANDHVNSRERVQTALRHEEPDRVPVDFLATPEVWAKLIAHLQPDTTDVGPAEFVDPSREALLRHFEIDTRVLSYDMFCRHPDALVPEGAVPDWWGSLDRSTPNRMWRLRNPDDTTLDIWGCHRQKVEHEFGAYEEFATWPLRNVESIADLDAHPWPEPGWWDFSP